MAIARSTANAQTEQACQVLLAKSAAACGRHHAAIAAFTEVQQVCSRTGLIREELDALIGRALTRTWAQEYAAALADADTAVQLAGRRHFGLHAAKGESVAAAALLGIGDTATAGVRARTAQSAHAACGSELWRIYSARLVSAAQTGDIRADQHAAVLGPPAISAPRHVP